MMYTQKIQSAIRFSIKTHEVYQKQKRKGKDIPYITHPLTVGLILSQAGADEDVVVAGILHDTIEDSVDGKKVTPEMLTERFGQVVSDLVMSVTEVDKQKSWEERKASALEHIQSFSHESVLVKSADVISNSSELIEDYENEGDKVFKRFNAPKELALSNTLKVITALRKRWPDSPLDKDLANIAPQLQMFGAVGFMQALPAEIHDIDNYSPTMQLSCPVCGWEGTPKDNGGFDSDEACIFFNCPNCDKMLFVAGFKASR